MSGLSNLLTLSVSRLTAILFLLLLATGCSNIIRSGLMNSNTIFLDPNTNRTVYTQLRNASENQQVTLNELNAKLTAKGYQLVKDPEQANYWIQAKVIYCHKAAEGVTPESVAKAGVGAGISSGGATMASAGDMSGGGMGAGMMGMGGRNAGYERLDEAGHGRGRRVPRYADATGSERGWHHVFVRDGCANH